jgi:hypothetical protein
VGLSKKHFDFLFCFRVAALVLNFNFYFWAFLPREMFTLWDAVAIPSGLPQQLSNWGSFNF